MVIKVVTGAKEVATSLVTSGVNFRTKYDVIPQHMRDDIPVTVFTSYERLAGDAQMVIWFDNKPRSAAEFVHFMMLVAKVTFNVRHEGSVIIIELESKFLSALRVAITRFGGQWKMGAYVDASVKSKKR